MKLTHQKFVQVLDGFLADTSTGNMSIQDAMEKLIASLPEPTAGLAELLPIPDNLMPPVPDGSIRMYWGIIDSSGKPMPPSSTYAENKDTHYLDIRLPKQEDPMRRGFEEAVKAAFGVAFIKRNANGCYENNMLDFAWKGWQASHPKP